VLVTIEWVYGNLTPRASLSFSVGSHFPINWFPKRTGLCALTQVTGRKSGTTI